ncbi:MAG: hypothetical protein D6778_03250 [Nitrospirae bacterium]|nr:MAG: hypothetical protein D6778_03250 [Nitrospirota bacterium]
MKQKIICVTGAHSSCGKTWVAEMLLRNLKGHWGALKYTKTSLYSRVTDETDTAPPEKDTGRLRRAGASRVVRIESPYEGLSEAVPLAMQLLSGCEGIVAEGNSLVEFLPADVVIFVFGKDPENLKPSARKVLEKADIRVYFPVQEGVWIQEVKERVGFD